METTFDLPYLNNKHIKSNIEDIFEFVKGEFDLELPENSTYKEKYFESVNKIQSTFVPYNNQKINIKFYDQILQDRLLELGMIEKKDLEDEKHIYPESQQIIIKDRIEKAIDLINLLHPSLGKLINDLVGTFLILRKDSFGGGSVSNILGLIWLNPQEDWSIIDYAEAIYHEFIHQSIFLDDMINSMFPDSDACATEDALVTSTILKIKRPLDRSYHAAGVSIGVMHLYYMFNDKVKSVQHMDDLRTTIEEINSRTQFLGEQGLLTLKELNKFLEDPDFETVTKILN